MTIPHEMSEQVSRGHPTFEQNIRGHAFNALTVSLGADPWLPLSRRKEIADTIGDAILAFLAPLGLNDTTWQPEGRKIPLRRREPGEVLACIAESDLAPDLKAFMAATTEHVGPQQ